MIPNDIYPYEAYDAEEPSDSIGAVKYSLLGNSMRGSIAPSICPKIYMAASNIDIASGRRKATT